MVKLFALIILLQGAADGGRAVNTDLRFFSGIGRADHGHENPN